MSITNSNSAMYIPWLIINMGGEMIYILQQRLVAQQITLDKQQRVLNDVINTMFNTKFINELLHNNKTTIYNITTVRSIYDRIVHSSIMRLNTSSMDKLYDLMSMAVKYQIMNTGTHNSYCKQILYNHMNSIKHICKDNTNNDNNDTYKLVTECDQELNNIYNTYNIYQWYKLRESVLSFYQDKKIKISLFLSEDIQNLDGHIVINKNNNHYGYNYNVKNTVGTVHYIQSNKTVTHNISNDVDDIKISNTTDLGSNIYIKDKRKLNNNNNQSNNNENNNENINNNDNNQQLNNTIHKHNNSNTADAVDELSSYSSSNNKHTNNELSILSSLLGHNSNNKHIAHHEYIDNLFYDDDDNDSNDIIDIFKPTINTQNIQANKLHNKLANIKLFDDNNKNDKLQGNTENKTNGDNNNNNINDLLELMDSVA